MRFLKRQLSLPVSRVSQWWVSRSSKDVIILASVEQHLPAAQRQWQVAELVEHHEIGADQFGGEPSGAADPGLGLELVDDVDGIKENRARALLRTPLAAIAMAR